MARALLIAHLQLKDGVELLLVHVLLFKQALEFDLTALKLLKLILFETQFLVGLMQFEFGGVQLLTHFFNFLSCLLLTFSLLAFETIEADPHIFYFSLRLFELGILISYVHLVLLLKCGSYQIKIGSREICPLG